MLNLFRNRWERILTKKVIIIIAVVVVPLMIGVAIFFSGDPVIKETIAIVSSKPITKLPSNSNFRVIQIYKNPEFSDLVLGKYAAIAEKNNTDYTITTLKNDSDKEAIKQFVGTGNLPASYRGEDQIRAERGIGTNILGFIVMLILMQGVALTTLFPEDRMLKTFKRILTSPVSEKKYLLVQSTFTFLCLYIPSYLAIVITKVTFDINIGFSLGMMAILLAILTILATAFSILMASIMERNLSLVTSGVSVVTSVLAGCFISFTPSNKILNALCTILPQKSFMTLIHGVEMGKNIGEFKNQLIYLFIWSVGLWLLGGFITKKRTNKGIY